MLGTSWLAEAQDQVLENNPSSLKWRQVNTPGFRIIYPIGFDKEAQKMANTLQHLYEAESETMGNETPKKISIILQNQNAISNGFVTLGPRRSEFYTMPPQDYNFIGTNRWLDLLAVHEFRHIVQFQQSKTGWNKLFYYLFGENTQAGMAFSAAPAWFWEGDATAIETSFTRSGRGRIPSFNRVFRANLLEGKRFNYHKQHLRSYKDFIPNHYVLGYHYATHLRRRTKDPDILEKVSHSAFGWPFIPFTFSNALKKHTGHFIVDNYEMMMDELDSVWSKQLEGVDVSLFEQITNRKNGAFTDYAFPRVLEDGTIIALKSGIGDVEQFVSLSGGKEKKEFVPGIMNNSGMLSSTQYKVVWNEYHYDPRWRVKTYSVIKSYDFASNELRTITKKSRYAGAAISPDGYKIATVLTTEDNDNYLVVVDYYSGKEVKRFENPENAFYSMPRWSDNGEKIVVLKTTDQGKAVAVIDNATGEERVLIPSGYENIGHPVLYQNYLFFNSPYNGIDNIYALDLDTQQRYQVTSSKYGAYNPAISNDGQYIYYNDHTVNGLDVVRIPFSPRNWKPITQVEDRSVKYYEPLVEQEGHEDILDEVPNVEYPVSKYSKLGHIFNLHSWGPFATTDLNQAQFGIFSRDVLSTTTMSLGYNYDIEEETGFASATLSYQGLYPIIDFEVQKGDRISDRGTIRGEEVKFKWDELSFETGLRLPLLLTRSKYHTQLSIGNAVRVTKVSEFENSVLGESRLAPINDTLAFFFRDELANGDLISNRASLSFFRLMKQSTRDLNSKWGQSITFEHFSTPYGGDFQGRLFALRANFYFPGVFKHHSFYIRTGYQSREADLSGDLYYFRNRIFKPRGFSYPDHEQFSSIQLNYALPIWYADVALGPVLNIKRLRANGFYDAGRGIGKNYFIEFTASQPRAFYSTLDESYYSAGLELLVDFNVMRFTPEISVGVRYSYLLTTNETNIELLLATIAF